MRVLHDICDMLNDELEDIVKTGGISRQDLEIVDTSVDIIKDIETIKAMKDAYPDDSRYSNRYPGYYYDDGMSMARGGRGGRSMRGGRGNYEYGYSRTDEKEMMEEKIEDLKRQLNQMK